MKYVFFFIFMCTVRAIDIPQGSSNFEIGPGTIIERGVDFYLYTKNMVMEITMEAIFLTEENVLSVKEELMIFQENLESIGQKYFAVNQSGQFSQIKDMSKLLYKEVNDKLLETHLKVNELRKWSIPHDVVERRNSMLFSALSGLGVFGSLIGIGLGIANLVQFRVEKQKVELLERENDLLVSQLNKQLLTLNKVVDELNKATSLMQQMGETQLLATTLTYYYTKISQVYAEIITFEEKTKDYIEAITLAVKGVLSPHLMPIKDLMLIIYNAQERMGWKPLVEPHRLEFYYSLISVRVEHGKILISIPFNPTDPWESYILQPFPTRFGVSTIPKISNYKALVLLSKSQNIYAVVYDDDKTLNCYTSLNSKICSIDSFIFQDIDHQSCLLKLVLNGTFMEDADRCLIGYSDYEKDTFSHRLTNGSTIRYDRQGFNVSCPAVQFQGADIGMLVDGCNITSRTYNSFSVNTITRGRTYFINNTWTSKNFTFNLPIFNTELKNISVISTEGSIFHLKKSFGTDHLALSLEISTFLLSLTGFVMMIGFYIRRYGGGNIQKGRNVEMTDFTDLRSATISRPILRFA